MERDVADFRLSDSEVAQLAEAKQKRKRASWYLSGPIPGDWLHRAALLPGRAFHLALAIRHVSNLRKRTTVLFESKWRDAFGVSASSERRNLDRLQSAGLIAVERQQGRRPRVTVLGSRGNPARRARDLAKLPGVELASDLDVQPAAMGGRSKV